MHKQHQGCHKPGQLFLSIAAHKFAFATTRHNSIATFHSHGGESRQFRLDYTLEPAVKNYFGYPFNFSEQFKLRSHVIFASSHQ